MTCPVCGVRRGRHPRLLDGVEAILCGPCVLAGAGDPPELAAYQRAMAEAAAEFHAWEARHHHGLASMDAADQETR